MKQRAFVRYTKSGKIVPGSLIITNGSCPKGPALWQEVIIDMCCKPCDCRTITNYSPTGWSLTDCTGQIWTCTNIMECERPGCIDISKPHSGITYSSTIDCRCQCVQPLDCRCYTVVNPSLTQSYSYNYTTCQNEMGTGFLDPGTSTIFCGKIDSVIPESGLLLSIGETCSPYSECAISVNICITYTLQNNTSEIIIVSFTPCDGRIPIETSLSVGATTQICATLGTLSAPGVTIVSTELGCTIA